MSYYMLLIPQNAQCKSFFLTDSQYQANVSPILEAINQVLNSGAR